MMTFMFFFLVSWK